MHIVSNKADAASAFVYVLVRFYSHVFCGALTVHAQTLLSRLKHMALDRLRVCLNIVLF